MTDPILVMPNALARINVGVSVSDSADLGRLGLTNRHCEVAVAELARAILLAGGHLTYGGRLRPEGFTQVILEEVRRYADGRNALTVCLAEHEHRKFDDEELREIDRRFGTSAKLICLDTEGNEVDPRHRPPPDRATVPAVALSGMRRHVTALIDARVVVGGRLSGYAGTMPGLVEEAILSLQNRQPLYVAGGFGGAAAAIARVLGRDDLTWAPPGFPIDSESAGDALRQLTSVHMAEGEAADGLSDQERHQLAATHRPGDIASIVVLGLARLSDNA
jgi:hypothetical protein